MPVSASIWYYPLTYQCTMLTRSNAYHLTFVEENLVQKRTLCDGQYKQLFVLPRTIEEWNELLPEATASDTVGTLVSRVCWRNISFLFFFSFFLLLFFGPPLHSGKIDCGHFTEEEEEDMWAKHTGFWNDYRMVMSMVRVPVLLAKNLNGNWTKRCQPGYKNDI